MLSWDVEPGAMVLLEPDDGTSIPGTLLEERDGCLLVGIGAAEAPGTRSEMSVSVFTPDNYWKLLAASRPRPDLGHEHPAHGPLVELTPRTEPSRIERRATPRVRMALPVTLAGAGVDDPVAALRGETLDVSAGGVRLRVQDAVPEDPHPTVAVLLPDGDEVRCRGRVVAVEAGDGAFEYRIEFLGVDPGADAALRELTHPPATAA